MSCELFERYSELKVCESDIEEALEMMIMTYRSGGKILVCGNGGSSADADHIVGELMKGFMLKRRMNESTEKKLRETLGDNAQRYVERLQCAIPAISLSAQSAVLSAYANDVDAELVYAQLVFGYARDEDMLIAISTSGNSKNVLAAAEVAKALGIKTLALTGYLGGVLSQICDCTIRVPETETYKIQELHLPVYHYLCAETERALFNK